MPKSDKYQHKILEIPVEPDVLHNFSTDDGLTGHLDKIESSEEMDALKQSLLDEIKSIINNDLTVRQRQVIKLRLLGHTQSDIGEQLDICQTTVHKVIEGNIDYSNNKKRYGGVIKKLKKICTSNENIQDILLKIEELKRDQT